jgi:ribosome-associated translation inhibitor RaiA
MQIQLHTEGFELTYAIRSFAEACARNAMNSIPDKLRVDSYLRKEGHGAFSCTLKGKIWRKAIVVKELGPDLYTLIAEAFKGLSRSIHKQKEKKKALVHKRAARLRESSYSLYS